MAEGLSPEGTVDLPQIGKVKKVYVYMGAAAVVSIVAFVWWKNKTSAPAAEDTPTSYYADTRTGAQTGDDAYTNPNPNTGDSSTPVVDSGAPTTNQEWTALAIQTFSWMDSGYLSGVLGKYLDRRQLTNEEADVVRQVWALIGKPPVGTYPIVLVTGGGSTPGTQTVPDVPSGLKVLGVTAGSVKLDWDDESGADKYRVYLGSEMKEVNGSAYEWISLKSNADFSFQVSSVNAAGESAKSGAVSAKTNPAPSTPAPAPTPPADGGYDTVTVVNFTKTNPPWNSTISGIAAHYGYGSNWQAVWNDNKNFGLRTSRKQPELIRAGDKVYVKRK
jgi:hypothetical protein